MEGAPKLGPNRGNAGKGRPKGALNKTTQLAKDAIAEAFHRLGGADRLVEWVEEDTDNEKVFYTSLLTKLIPVQTELSGPNGSPIQTQALPIGKLSESALREIAGLGDGV